MTPFQSGLRQLAEVFAQLDIEFLVGGSVASSTYGVVRATLDVDVLAAMTDAHCERLAAALGEDFYADRDQMRDALQQVRAFNLVHHVSGQKIDVFPAVNAFHASELERRIVRDVPVGATSMRLPIATAEDILLAKLLWFRSGGEISDRQWGDITALIRVRGKLLDMEYARRWARELRVEDLLDRAIGDVEYH